MSIPVATKDWVFRWMDFLERIEPLIWENIDYIFLCLVVASCALLFWRIRLGWRRWRARRARLRAFQKFQATRVVRRAPDLTAPDRVHWN